MALAFVRTQATRLRARVEDVKQGDVAKAVAAVQRLPDASLPDVIEELERLKQVSNGRKKSPSNVASRPSVNFPLFSPLRFTHPHSRSLHRY